MVLDLLYISYHKLLGKTQNNVKDEAILFAASPVTKSTRLDLLAVSSRRLVEL